MSRSDLHMTSASSAKLQNPVYRRDIDGLRAIAVTSVVFYHAGLWPLNSGYVGVDIFFVISGFLIGGILNRETRAGTFSFARFYARRARRILPALIAVVTLVSLASLALMGARELRQTGLSAGTALLGISNIYFWWSTNYFAP
ncbi:MAG: acyltransferase [Pseudomonadota bacterium]